MYSEAEAVGPHWWRRLLLQGQLGLTTELSSVLILPQADLDGGGHVHRGPDHLGVTVHLVLVWAASHREAAWTQRETGNRPHIDYAHTFSRLADWAIQEVTLRTMNTCYQNWGC